MHWTSCCVKKLLTKGSPLAKGYMKVLVDEIVISGKTGNDP